MRKKICLFLDYLSEIPVGLKRDILFENKVEVIAQPFPATEDSLYKMGDNSYERISAYRAMIREFRSFFSISTPDVLDALLKSGDVVDLPGISAEARTFISYVRNSKKEPFDITRWALKADNWFLVSSELSSFELQSRISADFPVLVFDNIPIECSSAEKPDVKITNIEDALQAAGIYQLWQKGYMGEKSRVVICDTGVTNSLAAKYNISQKSIGGLSTEDEDGHGSAIAELIMRICPKAEMTSVKVLNSHSSGELFDLISGLSGLIYYENAIVNMSVGVFPQHLKNLGVSLISFKESMTNIAKGVIDKKNFLIAAAGNDSSPQLRWPAAANNILAVGSHNTAYQLSQFSNYENKASNFILSMGGDVRSLDQRIEELGKYGYGLSRSMYGTSFSTAIASGVSGLLTGCDWFRQMSIPSRISLFKNHCRKNDHGYPVLNIADIGAIWPI